MSFIFLSYAREDQKHAEVVWQILTDQGILLWMDRERLLPGERWDPAIRKAIDVSVGAIFLASRHSLAKDSYIQQELDALVQKAGEMPEEEIYLIVARLDDSVITDSRLQAFHWVDFFGAGNAKSLQKMVESAWKSEEHAERRKDREASDNKGKDKEVWKPYVPAQGTTGLLFVPSELDIYVNKRTKEAFIFHGKVISYDISHLLYVPESHSVVVVMNDGSRLDLGVKIQWLIRAHFTKAKKVRIMRTKDGASQEEVVVPLRQGVLGTHGAQVWPSRPGMYPFIAADNAMRGRLYEERKETPRKHQKIEPDMNLAEELQQSRVIAAWLQRILVGCLVLLVMALVGAGVLIGKLL